ncbi:hypothetical protein [Streptomyces flavofungini]|uniref:NACHT domain-containing protein n=1 Tax=Streptomyces flavofungini TaxID=68200 RepID=A0ABS0WY11_9ACTN|nr:hypothetical protein [Streptomyces flavofungini]MBJ3805811.1 hypothetical protein [Streptomyces flavofungini]GHC75468.1 hypothetical protein GCM10010349_54560 [Streptomyces flavofungini]
MVDGDDGDTYNSVFDGEYGHLIQAKQVSGSFAFNGPTTINTSPGPATGPPARSAYWEHVRLTAPRQLVDREAELAELAAFCRGAGDRSYAWWRAGAWAGKTALLSWFALHPPPGVRVVPFFVTARWAAQNDRTAFVEVVLEQLAEMLGEPLPPNLTESTREAHLLQLLGQAAQVCAARHERLVLLVDGLDEDRGVTAGPDAHSIAGLLPQPTDPALRVVVAGRPNPPIPTDVPDHHPLRTACAVRTLTPSERAGAIRGAAELELGQLVAKGGLHLDALGLITAARGGLTAEDLARLTDSAPYELQEVLRTSAGRTFEVREAVVGASHSGGAAYLLAHEELHLQAERMLGAPRLDALRQRLHAWADSYRERGWPEDTPGYLLRGYFALVRAQQDLARTVAVAVDPARHERLYRATGGDVATLTEIRDAQEAIVEAGGRGYLPDMLRLALHRDALTHRNRTLPAELPEAWAALGHARRAVALAQSIPDGDERVDAVLRVAERVRARGEHRHAIEIVEDLAAAAARDTTPLVSGPRLARVVRTWLAWGELSRATAVVGLLPDGVQRENVLPAVVAAVAARGPAEDAERLARSSADDRTRTLSLIALAEGAARAGEDERADALFAEARTTILEGDVLAEEAGWRLRPDMPFMPHAHPTGDEDEDHTCCRALASALAVTGRREAAEEFVELLLSSAGPPPDDVEWFFAPSSHATVHAAADAARAELALEIALSADAEDAIRYLTAAGTPATTSPQIARVCAVLVVAGRHELADGVARSTLSNTNVRREVLLRLAAAGRTDLAVDLAALLPPDPRARPVALDLCRLLVRHGHYDDAEAAARTLLTPENGLAEVALALAEAGRTAQALALAQAVRASAATPRTLSTICLILLAAGHADEAERTLAEAESGYRRVLPHLSDAESRARVAGQLARAGCPEALLLLADAEALLLADTEQQGGAKSGDDALPPYLWMPTSLDTLRSIVVEALVEAGEVDRALGHIDADRPGAARELTLVVRRLAADGRAHLAEAVVRGLPDPTDRATARWAIVEVLAERGADADTVAVAKLLAKLSEGDFPVEALAQGITRLAAVGRRDLALELHSQLMATPSGAPQSRGEAVARARAAYAVGDHPTAEELLAKAERTPWQDAVSPDLVRGLLATGQADRAEEYIREQWPASDEWVVPDGLPDLIRVFTEAGEHDRAEALIESFPRTPDVRDAYVTLALALPPDRAAPAAARAAHIGPWTAALPALLHADPATVDALTAPEVWSRLVTE